MLLTTFIFHSQQVLFIVLLEKLIFNIADKYASTNEYFCV